MIPKSKKRKPKKKTKIVLVGGYSDIDINSFLKDDPNIDIMLMNHGINKLIEEYTPDIEKFIDFFKNGADEVCEYVCNKIKEKYKFIKECPPDLHENVEADIKIRLKTLFNKFK